VVSRLGVQRQAVFARPGLARLSLNPVVTHMRIHCVAVLAGVPASPLRRPVAAAAVESIAD